jgi:aldose 1-epimerase
MRLVQHLWRVSSSASAKNMEAVCKAKEAHNRTCRFGGQATEVHLSWFDIERMGWESGDVICGLVVVGTRRCRRAGCASPAMPSPAGAVAARKSRSPKEVDAVAADRDLVPAGAPSAERGLMASIDVERAAEAPGGPVDRYTLRSASGAEVAILTLGGIVQSIRVPDRDGALAGVVLGFATADGYLSDDYLPANAYFGCIAGRYANRIAGGRFTLDGPSMCWRRTTGPNHLHGGDSGFDRRLWTATPAEGDGSAQVALSRTSPDGEEGYPGTVEVRVTYTWTDDHVLSIDYHARTDRPTIVNLTNHSYFNLAGEGSGSIDRHELTIHASRFTPLDETQIPTGELAPVDGTPFDFRAGRAIGPRVREAHPQLVLAQGYDHNLVLDGYGAGGGEDVHLAAELHDPGSGRRLEVHTTEPGLQLYSGNYLDGTVVGAGGRIYRQGDGMCLETQHFPNSPNVEDFPSTELRPGEELKSRTELRFSA